MKTTFKAAVLAAAVSVALTAHAHADDNDEYQLNETVSLRFIDSTLFASLPTDRSFLFTDQSALGLYNKYCQPQPAPPAPPAPPAMAPAILPTIIAAIAPKIINFAVDKLIGVFEAKADRAQASFGANTSTFVFYKQAGTAVTLNRPCFILERRASPAEGAAPATAMALIGAFNFAEGGKDAGQIGVLMSYYALSKAQSSKNKIHAAVSMQVNAVWDDGKKINADKIADFDLLNVNVGLPVNAVCSKSKSGWVCDQSKGKLTWMDLEAESSATQSRGYGAFSNSPLFPRIPFTTINLPAGKQYVEVGNVTLSAAVLESSDAGKLYAWLAKKARANQTKLEDALKNAIGVKEESSK